VIPLQLLLVKPIVLTVSDDLTEWIYDLGVETETGV